MRHLYPCTAFVVAALVLAFSLPLHSQQKKSNSDEARLRQQVQKLENDVKRLQGELNRAKGDDRKDDVRIAQLQDQVRQKDAKINQLQADLKRAKGDDKSDDAVIKNLQSQLAEKDKTLTKLQADFKVKSPAELTKEIDALRQKVQTLESLKKTRYVHSMILKLGSKGSDQHVRDVLVSAPKTLGQIKGVRNVWVGKPAGIAAGDAVRDFQLGVVLVFDNSDDARRFHDDPAHKRFVEDLKKFWEKPVVYDFVP